MSSSGLRPEHFRGASSELRAAAHFLSDGWEVYVPCVQQGSADFIIRRGAEFRTVQVKTATLSESGFLQVRIRGTNADRPACEVADLWVVVFRDNLWVIPAEEIDSSNLSLLSGGVETTARHRKWGRFRIQ